MNDTPNRNDEQARHDEALNHEIAHEDHFGFSDEEWQALTDIASQSAGTVGFARRLRKVVDDMEDPETSPPDEPMEVQLVAGRFHLLMYWMAWDTAFADVLYGMLTTEPRRN